MGIFDKQFNDLYATYHVEVQLRDRLMGGTPKDPKIIEGWLGRVIGQDKEAEVRRATVRTLQELGVDVTSDTPWDDVLKAAEGLAAVRNTNGFKRHPDTGNLAIEGRTIKAAMKETTNVLYAGERWGSTKKGPKAFLAERVFVNPDWIDLGVAEPDGVELIIGHVNGPKGPQSTLTYVEFVRQPKIAFDVIVVRDLITAEQWPEIWLHAQENGLGALRSQGFGRFDVAAFDPVAGGNGTAAKIKQLVAAGA